MTPAPPDGTRTAWDEAPCGLLTCTADGTITDANATALRWVHRPAHEVVGRMSLTDLFPVGARIYWETHLAPLLHVERELREVALDLRGPAGRLPVLLAAAAEPADPADGPVRTVHVALSSAAERLRYERELLAARTTAERAVEQVRVLQEVTAALSGSLGVEGVVAALLRTAVPGSGAQAGTLWLHAPGRGLLRSGGVGEDPADCPEPDPEPSTAPVRTHRGRVLVALRGPAGLSGVLSLRPPALAPSPAPGGELLDEDVLAALGRHAGLALERARMHERDAGVAHTLQRSLLAVEPPRDARYAVATVYRPGVEALEVGGDWYDVFSHEVFGLDVFPRGDPRRGVPGAGRDVLSLVVGDVVGRGLGAASAMGQLRSAVRAVAGPWVGPGALLTRLDAFAEQVEAAALATVAYGELDLELGRLRYACAGHPPPLLLRAGAEPELLWRGRSTPLAASVPGLSRPEAEVWMRPGDRLLLYTDGLVERRRRELDAGLRALVETAAGVGDVPVAEAVRSLTGELLRDEDGHDDVCVLLLAWNGPAGGVPRAAAARW
ncbi:hypothetical protein NUM3379_24730 [Kineococcus sp. NUM-3379]